MLPWQSQVEMVRAIWTHPQVARELSGLLRFHHFENPALGKITETLFKIAAKDGETPTGGQVRQALSKLEPHMEAACLSLLPDVEAAECPAAGWAQEQGLLYAAHQEGIILAGEMPRLLRDGRYGELRNRLVELLALAAPRGEVTIADVSIDAIRRRQMRTDRVVPTGITRLDGHMGGGAIRGESYHVLAKKSGGKGQTLVSIGTVATLAMLRVFHVTLEDRADTVWSRYERSFTNCTRDEVWAQAPELSGAIRELHSRLTVIDGTRGSFTMDALRSSLDKLRGGAEPDVIVLDYLQRMDSGMRLSGDVGGGRRYVLGKLAEEIQELAAERGVVLWTGYQSNRDGVRKMWGSGFTSQGERRKESGLLNVTDYAEAYEASRPPAGIISINQSMTEEGTRYGKVYLAEQREGPKGKVIEATLDWAKSRVRDSMDELPPAGPDPVEMRNGEAVPL